MAHVPHADMGLLVMDWTKIAAYMRKAPTLADSAVAKRMELERSRADNDG